MGLDPEAAKRPADGIPYGGALSRALLSRGGWGIPIGSFKPFSVLKQDQEIEDYASHAYSESLTPRCSGSDFD